MAPGHIRLQRSINSQKIDGRLIAGMQLLNSMYYLFKVVNLIQETCCSLACTAESSDTHLSVGCRSLPLSVLQLEMLLIPS